MASRYTLSGLLKKSAAGDAEEMRVFDVVTSF